MVSTLEMVSHINLIFPAHAVTFRVVFAMFNRSGPLWRLCVPALRAPTIQFKDNCASDFSPRQTPTPQIQFLARPVILWMRCAVYGAPHLPAFDRTPSVSKRKHLNNQHAWTSLEMVKRFVLQGVLGLRPPTPGKTKQTAR